MPDPKAKTRAAQARYRDNNRELLREKSRARSRAWYAVNGDRVRAESKAWRAANPGASSAQTKSWRKANPDKVKALHLKRYGISLAGWTALFVSQGSKCASCSSPDPRSRKGWHTDHDHDTGAVRGILCHHCNVTLGRLGDNADGVARGCAQLSRYLAGPHTHINQLPVHAGLLLQI